MMRAEASAEGGARASQGRSLVRGIGQVLASQIALALVGFLTLPILGRRLGPEAYGDFSLFVTLLGVVTYQDVARQLLILEHSRRSATPADGEALTRASTTLIVVLAALVGAFALEPVSAAALVAIALLHGLSSRSYAALAARGRVGAATAIRNFAWSGAFAASCALAFVSSGPLVYALPFVVALGAVLLLYRSCDEAPATGPSLALASDPAWQRWSGWAHLKRSPNWPQYRAAALDLLGFTLASSVVAATDRLLLEKTVGGEELGLYCGAYDLATRVHVVSAALSATLFPLLATQLHEQGFERTARRFTDLASWLIACYFLGLLALLAADRALLDIFLGPAFAASRPLFALLLIGVFVHAFGFLVTPWQRARGDFASQRRAYVRAALVMVTVGIFLVPMYGALGALIAYLCSRVAEVQLVWCELRTWPSALVPRRRIAVALAMAFTLAALATWRFLEFA